MKAVVAAFNQEKALVGAFSVIVQLHRLTDLRHYSNCCPSLEDGEDEGAARGSEERRGERRPVLLLRPAGGGAEGRGVRQ